MKIALATLISDNDTSVIMNINYTETFFGFEKNYIRKAYRNKSNGVNYWRWLDSDELIYPGSDSLEAIYSSTAITETFIV